MTTNVNETFSREETIRLRKTFIGKSCTLFFRENPLKIVRGAGQYLYDENNEKYLDCINNVAHVGHCHPHVVRATAEQNALLCTNSRFLHDNIVGYAQRLAAYFPNPLCVCYFVNSGSEATDLALQLAWAHTGRKDVIVLDDAYHGHLYSALNVSPYKFNKMKGHKKKNWVHVAPLPCVYRGKFTQEEYPQCDLGRLYAEDFKQLLEGIDSQTDHKVAAFLAEALISCGGQVIPPSGYYKEVFSAVRRAGGVCIMDEVQSGFGRVGGNHMWAFELHGVVPDIVTMGKPMGNGHPVAAVITTAAIAASHEALGAGYFNTFGGNPVSVATASAVLDVIERENLRTNAARVGKYLLESLTKLKTKHQLIGDVRGVGLFIGIDLVLSPFTKQPATQEAQTILRKMKDRHILLSTDGRFDNVLKIKPPLVFSETDAQHLVRTLDEVLGEVEARMLNRTESMASASSQSSTRSFNSSAEDSC